MTQRHPHHQPTPASPVSSLFNRVLYCKYIFIFQNTLTTDSDVRLKYKNITSTDLWNLYLKQACLVFFKTFSHFKRNVIPCFIHYSVVPCATTHTQCEMVLHFSMGFLGHNPKSPNCTIFLLG